jgi:hypothetical protein
MDNHFFLDFLLELSQIFVCFGILFILLTKETFETRKPWWTLGFYLGFGNWLSFFLFFLQSFKFVLGASWTFGGSTQRGL